MPSLKAEHEQWKDELSNTLIVNGFIYIGVQNQDPEVMDQTIYSDRALTVPISNPQRTGSDGRSINKIWVADEYSITVTDSAGVQKYTNQDSGDLLVEDLTIALASSSGSTLIGHIDSGTGAVATTVNNGLNWTRKSLFSFMTTAEIADVEARTKTLDVTTAVQTAITTAAGRPLQAHEGTYRITSQLNYTTASAFAPGLKLIGEGMFKTIFDTEVTSAMLRIIGYTSGVVVHRQADVLLRGFSITGDTTPATATGIHVNGIYYGLIEDVSVIGLTGDGLKFDALDTVGDLDASTSCLVQNNRFTTNTGWGIHVKPAASGIIGLVYTDFKYNAIDGNAEGGLYLAGVDGVEVYKNSCTTNGGTGNNGGILIDHFGITNRNVDIVRNELGNNNNPQNIKINSLVNGTISRNRELANAADTDTTKGVILGDNTNTVSNVLVEKEYVSVNSAIDPFTYITIGTNLTTANNIRVNHPYYATFDAGTQIRYSDTSKFAEIQDDVGEVKPFDIPFYSATTSTTYTPIVGTDKVHRILTDTATLTINAPTGNPSDWEELILIVNNSSGGALTVTFNAAFKHVGYTDPANGFSRTATFRYNVVSGNWLLIGDWSGDI